MKNIQGNIWWISWSILILVQIGFSFWRYNPSGSMIVRILGWIIMGVGFIIGGMGASTLRKEGEIQEPEGGRSSRYGVGTTKLVCDGIYSLVRHPLYLCWIFFAVALALISQDWVVAGIGFASIFSIHMQACQDDIELKEKFGKDYESYMEQVPRMNIFLGIYKQLRSGT